VIRDYSLLRVKVVDSETVISKSDADVDIQTWYKLQIIESLHRQTEIGESPILEGSPDRLQPLQSSESLLVLQGGVVDVDGVKVVRVFTNGEPSLTLNGEYLIPAKLEYGGKQMTPISGTESIFKVDGAALRPLGHKNGQFVREVQDTFGNDLSRIRSHVQFSQYNQKK
jgi:hypothetical protein